MDAHIRKVYVPMTETGRKIYQITDLGRDVLNLELARIERLYKNSKGERYNGR